MANENRAERARKALDSYDGDLGSLDENIIDLLTDIMHLCHQQTGMEFLDALNMARTHFEAEE